MLSGIMVALFCVGLLSEGREPPNRAGSFSSNDVLFHCMFTSGLAGTGPNWPDVQVRDVIGSLLWCN